MVEASYEKVKQFLIDSKACDHCMGRQFHHAFLGYTNDNIGAAIREASSEKDVLELLKKGTKPGTSDGCPVCKNIFKDVGRITQKAIEIAANYDYATFLVGARVDSSLSMYEENLWGEIGAKNSETLKKELVRTIGLALEEAIGKTVDFDAPDITFLADFTADKVTLQIHALFMYGQYRKLVSMPQTKWWCTNCRGRGCPDCGFRGKMYEESVEEIIAPAFLRATGGKSEKFHGSGREDIDAKMLGLRPFVMEVDKPIRRNIDFAALEKEINTSAEGKIEVHKLRASSKEEMRFLKTVRHEKTYEAIVECESEYDPAKLKDIEALSGATIDQKTPERVAHRRADLVRKRKILTIKAEPIDKTTVRAEIRAEAGTYIKELVSGDNGNTKPSFAEFLGNCKIKELNVLEIHGEKELSQ